MVENPLFGKRPVEGYIEQGAQAYLDGISESQCPHDESSLARFEWQLGYANEVLLQCGDDVWTDEALLFTDNQINSRREISIIINEARSLVPSALEVAERIGIPVMEWPSRCAEISAHLLRTGMLSPLVERHGQPRTAYGFYDGEISKHSIFAGRPIARHGWIEFPSGLVVDPTRWVFSASPPEIWAGSTENYDFGMRRFRHRRENPCPKFDSAERQIRLVSNDPEVARAFARALNDKKLVSRMTVTTPQAFWLANRSPDKVPEPYLVFRELIRMGCEAFIPMDTKNDMTLPDEVIAEKLVSDVSSNSMR